MTGETFDILSFSGLSGDFDSLSYFGHARTATSAEVWTCGAGPVFEEVIGAGSLALVVERGVPEPSTWVMLATGFLGLAGLGVTRRARAA